MVILSNGGMRSWWLMHQVVALQGSRGYGERDGAAQAVRPYDGVAGRVTACEDDRQKVTLGGGATWFGMRRPAVRNRADG